VAVITIAACARRPKRPPAAQDSEENQAVLHKLEGYAKCLELASPVFELADVYTRRFASAPPTETTDDPVEASPDPGECLDGLVKSAELAPHDAVLEHTANNYAAALATVHALTSAEHDAFDPGSKHHAPAHGVELHPKLVAALHDFDAAANALYDQVYALNRKAHEDQYKRRLAFDGRTFTMMNEDMMLRAEDFVRRAAVVSDRLDALPVDDLAERAAALETVAQVVREYADAHRKDADELIKPYWPMSDAIDKYLVAVRQLVSRARAHVPYTEGERIMIAAGNEKAVPGTPAALVEAYNRLCATYSPLGQWPR
jgi:hypothetical protein